jgi:hypothetical protein
MVCCLDQASMGSTSAQQQHVEQHEVYVYFAAASFTFCSPFSLVVALR